MKKTLRATAIIGSSSLASIGAGIVKTKVIALVVGATGLGALSLLQSVLTTTSAAAGLGLGTSAVPAVAAADERGDAATLRRLRRISWLAPLVSSAVAAAFLVILRRFIAARFGAGETFSTAIALIAVGVTAAAVTAGLIGWINGVRGIRELANINVATAATSAAVAIVAVWRLPDLRGITIAVLSYPLANVLFAIAYFRKTARVARGDADESSVGSKPPVLWPLLSLGLATTASGFLTEGTFLVARSRINDVCGLADVGQFQAAYSIAMVYLTFVLNSMAPHYFPTLSAARDDAPRMREIVNEQLGVGMLLAGPVILGMFVTAPFVIRALYAGDFRGAVPVLRWELVGDCFKLPSWTFGFVLLAQGRTISFFITELAWDAIFAAIVWAGVPSWGVSGAGIAFAVAYLIHAGVLYIVLRRIVGFRMSHANLTIAIGFSAAAATILGVHDRFAGAWIVQLAVVAVLALVSLRRIRGALRERGE